MTDSQMNFMSRVLNQLPRLRTKIQLTGLAVTVAGFSITRATVPDQLPAQLSAGAIGIVMIVFAQIFHFIEHFPAAERASLVLRLFIIFVVLVLSLFGLVIWQTTMTPGKETEIKAAMHDAMAQGKYQAADLYADDLLKLKPESSSAWNVKGSVAFYSRQFIFAAQCFEKARSEKNLDAASKRAILKNLGDAYIESGQTSRAIQTYKEIPPDGKEDLIYRFGRAYFYDGQYAESLPLLKSVPTSFESGKARVLEAAALVGLAKMEPNEDLRSKQLSTAADKLREGIYQQPTFWTGILDRGVVDKGEGYTKAKELLAGVPRPVN